MATHMVMPHAERAAVDIHKADLPEFNLRRGQVGTVVEILASGKAFEIEFSYRDGRTYESLGLRPDQFMVLCFEPANTPPHLVMTPA